MAMSMSAKKKAPATSHPKRFSLVPTAAQQTMYRVIEAAKPAFFSKACGTEVAEIAACLALGKDDPVIAIGAAAGAVTVRKLAATTRRGARALREATVQAVSLLITRKNATALICAGRVGEEASYAEAFRFAGTHKLPIIFLVSNFLEAPRGQGRDLRALYAEFGTPVFSVDANDSIATYRVVTEALHTARHQRGPSVVEVLTLNGPTPDREASLHLLEGYMKRHGSWHLDH